MYIKGYLILIICIILRSDIFMKFVEQRYEKGFWLMSSLTALFVIFSLILFLYNEYEKGT